MVTTTIGLRFDAQSTNIRLLMKGNSGHSDATLAADPLVAATLTYLFIYAAAQQPDRDVSCRMVVARSN